MSGRIGRVGRSASSAVRLDRYIFDVDGRLWCSSLYDGSVSGTKRDHGWSDEDQRHSTALQDSGIPANAGIEATVITSEPFKGRGSPMHA